MGALYNTENGAANRSWGSSGTAAVPVTDSRATGDVAGAGEVHCWRCRPEERRGLRPLHLASRPDAAVMTAATGDDARMAAYLHNLADKADAKAG